MALQLNVEPDENLAALGFRGLTFSRSAALPETTRCMRWNPSWSRILERARRALPNWALLIDVAFATLRSRGRTLNAKRTVVDARTLETCVSRRRVGALQLDVARPHLGVGKAGPESFARGVSELARRAEGVLVFAEEIDQTMAGRSA